MGRKSLCMYYGYYLSLSGFSLFLRKKMILRIHKRLKHFDSSKLDSVYLPGTCSQMSRSCGSCACMEGMVSGFRRTVIKILPGKLSLYRSVAPGPFPQKHLFPQWSFYTGLLGTEVPSYSGMLFFKISENCRSSDYR